MATKCGWTKQHKYDFAMQQQIGKNDDRNGFFFLQSKIYTKCVTRETNRNKLHVLISNIIISLDLCVPAAAPPPLQSYRSQFAVTMDYVLSSYFSHCWYLQLKKEISKKRIKSKCTKIEKHSISPSKWRAREEDRERKREREKEQ